MKKQQPWWISKKLDRNPGLFSRFAELREQGVDYQTIRVQLQITKARYMDLERKLKRVAVQLNKPMPPKASVYTPEQMAERMKKFVEVYRSAPITGSGCRNSAWVMQQLGITPEEYFKLKKWSYNNGLV